MQASAGLLEDLRAVLALADPVPAAVSRAARAALHEAELRYPPDQVVGMGYFPDELGLTSRPLQGPQGPSKVTGP